MSYWREAQFALRNAFLSPGKYHGLSNQGATCYLNSVLQVLFMTEDFREAVARPRGENTDFIDHHLTRLFGDLKQQIGGTHEITRKLEIDRVNEQRDAAQYYEKILSLTSPEASKIFHGELTHRTICLTCHKETDSDGFFWLLPLTLVDSMTDGHYKVVDGIKEFFRPSSFSGDNQMYCEDCDDKSDATVECVMKHHPEVLVLLIKRFEFNYNYMMYVKVNCAVDVPSTLQIPQNQTYELYAVVDHFGDLRSGHYNAKIKSEDDQRWYCFNDTIVSELDHQDGFDESCSAYLLFYRRKNGHAADPCTQPINGKECPLEDAQHAISDQCQDVEKEEEKREEEADEEADMGDDTAAAVSRDKNQETGVSDIVSVESRGVGRSPDRCFNVEDQINGASARDGFNYDNQENNEDVNDEKQRDEVKIKMTDWEDMRGNTEPEKTEALFRETKEEGNDGAGLDDRQKRPEEGDVTHDTSFNDHEVNTHVRHDYVEQVNTQRDEERDNVKGGNEDVGGTQAVGRGYSPKPVSVDEPKGEERMEVRHEVERKDGDSSRYKRREQTEEEGDVHRVSEQKRGGDKSLKQIETTETKPSLNEYVKDQDEGGHLVPHTRVEQEHKGHEWTPNREDAALRREASAGGKQGDRQPECHEKTVEGRRGSNKSRTYQGMLIEEEIRITPSGTQRSIEKRDIIIETREGSSQDDAKRKSDAKTNARVSFLERLNKLKLSKKKEPKKRATKRAREMSPDETETSSKKIRLLSPRASSKPHTKKTDKKKKSLGCFSFFRLKKRKNKQMSE